MLTSDALNHSKKDQPLVFSHVAYPPVEFCMLIRRLTASYRRSSLKGVLVKLYFLQISAAFSPEGETVSAARARYCQSPTFPSAVCYNPAHVPGAKRPTALGCIAVKPRMLRVIHSNLSQINKGVGGAKNMFKLVPHVGLNQALYQERGVPKL